MYYEEEPIVFEKCPHCDCLILFECQRGHEMDVQWNFIATMHVLIRRNREGVIFMRPRAKSRFDVAIDLTDMP